MQDGIEKLSPFFMHTFHEFRRQAKEARALGNETRMKVLQLLMNQPRCVVELASILGIRSVNTTKHLRTLRLVGFVDGKRKGQRVYFFLTSRAANSFTLKKLLRKGVLGT